jgi:hypothetical protein
MPNWWGVKVKVRRSPISEVGLKGWSISWGLNQVLCPCLRPKLDEAQLVERMKVMMMIKVPKGKGVGPMFCQDAESI